MPETSRAGYAPKVWKKPTVSFHMIFSPCYSWVRGRGLLYVSQRMFEKWPWQEEHSTPATVTWNHIPSPREVKGTTTPRPCFLGVEEPSPHAGWCVCCSVRHKCPEGAHHSRFWGNSVCSPISFPIPELFLCTVVIQWFFFSLKTRPLSYPGTRTGSWGQVFQQTCNNSVGHSVSFPKYLSRLTRCSSAFHLDGGWVWNFCRCF